MINRIRKGLRFSAYSVVIGFSVGHFVLTTVGSVAAVGGSSMQPTLNPGKIQDWVYLNKWATRNYELERGEIISFTSPTHPEDQYIKRVIGLPGDLISTINNKENKIVEVPKGQCWVEGDNARTSNDSNMFGPLNLGLITAKAKYIIWPPSRWQMLDKSLPVHRTPLNLS